MQTEPFAERFQRLVADTGYTSLVDNVERGKISGIVGADNHVSRVR